MKRLVATFSVSLCALTLSPAAFASTTPAHAAQAAAGQATGAISVLGASWLTIQTSGRRTGVINALISAGNPMTKNDYPYVWGGGHPEAGVASALAGAKGHTAKVVGFDCSGSVAAVLSRAGLWSPGAPVPNDAGVITQLLQEKLIARGPGSGPSEVTLYDHPGVHIFMNIDGRFFGTSDGGGGGGSSKGGPGWLADGAPDAFNSAFKQYHFLSAVLKTSTSYGQTLTFQTSGNLPLLQTAVLGDEVTVNYSPGESGTILATALSYVGAQTTSGTLTAIAPDGSSFTLQTPTSASDTFNDPGATLATQLTVGDTVTVTYTATTSAQTARGVLVTATPTPAPTTTSTTPNPSSDQNGQDPSTNQQWGGGGQGQGGGDGPGSGGGHW